MAAKANELHQVLEVKVENEAHSYLLGAIAVRGRHVPTPVVAGHWVLPAVYYFPRALK